MICLCSEITQQGHLDAGVIMETKLF